MRQSNKEIFKHRQPRPTIGTQTFTLKDNSYELIHNCDNLYVYRRTASNSGKLIAYEVVVKENANSTYPRDEAFGITAWCYTGSDASCKRLIESQFNSIRFD